MKTNPASAELIPPALLARVQELAAAERRAAADVLREAIEGYLDDRQQAGSPRATPFPREGSSSGDALVARVLDLRRGNAMTDGDTLKDRVSFGRA
jgi:hypothetical protein